MKIHFGVTIMSENIGVTQYFASDCKFCRQPFGQKRMLAGVGGVSYTWSIVHCPSEGHDNRLSSYPRSQPECVESVGKLAGLLEGKCKQSRSNSCPF